MSAPTRPALRWHGGKWRLAPWIVQHFPAHRLYTEAFGGAASVLLRKPRSYAEVYNDLDDDVVNLFRVLRSERAPELLAALRTTPFARAEFELAYEVSTDPVEEARRLVVRSFMGFGSDGFNREVTAGFRANAHRSGTTPAQDWANLPDALTFTVERLRGVVIEHRHAVEVFAQHDAADTLHYVDPPYLHETRSQKNRGAEAEAWRTARLREPTGCGAAVLLGDTGEQRLSDPEFTQLRGAGRRGEGSAAQQPSRTFWSGADWLWCRDRRWRPVEPGSFPLVASAPARMGRLRAYGNAITAEVATAFIAACLDVLPADEVAA